MDSNKLNVLIEQVSQFTEGLTEIKLLIREQSQTAREQAETARHQASNIVLLSQAIERQSAIIDRLLSHQ